MIKKQNDTRFFLDNISIQRLTLLCSFLIMFATSSFAQSVRYELRMDSPSDHYFQVDFFLSDYKTSEIEVKLPVWTPGSYLVREFAKSINLVRAFDENGKELIVDKKSKNSWTIQRAKAKEVRVSYQVYAFELTVRTSFLDQTHGFVSGSGIFMYTEQTRNKPGQLTVFPHASFSKITTSLEKIKTNSSQENAHSYTFLDYDQLVDSPIEIGNHEEFTFQAAGIPHTVALYGWGNYQIDRLKIDMAKIVEAATDVFGHNPCQHYTFIIHNVTQAQGGLEHLNSTVLSVNRFTYHDDNYLGFLSLVAHEYFHLWNVKRLRPFELGPFDYDREVYTSLLWVMEGFTSYYDELLMLRAGFYSENQLINKLISGINYVEGTPGVRVQPVAHASFDAWIKSYRPNENSSNTTISYYSKGAALALLIDALIMDKFDGQKCLDHFLRELYQKYYEKLNRGFTASEFQGDLSTFLGENMDDFFARYINGTETPDYVTILDKIGLKLTYVGQKKPSFGASLLQSEKRLTVQTVRSGSAAEKAGLSANDEIIALNGIRMNKNDFEKQLITISPDTSFEVLVSRDNVLISLQCDLQDYETPKYQVAYPYHSTKEPDSERKNKLRTYWLREINN